MGDSEPRVLIVSRDRRERASIAERLEATGLRVHTSGSPRDAWSTLRRRGAEVVVSDVEPAGEGIALLRKVRGVGAASVVLFGPAGDVGLAVQAMKEGASDFFALPNDLARLATRVKALARAAQPRDPVAAQLVGRSAAMRRVRERVRALAGLRVPVLVCGEAGTGRDRVVRVLHGAAPEAGGRMAVLRCGEGPGRHPEPAGRVVYLDGVDRLGRAEQIQWLEALRARRSAAQRGPRRVIASTALDLAERAAEGAFHPELARELLRFTIPLPPLRARLDDLAQLVPHLAERIGREMGRAPARFDRGALAALRAQPWPGNLRQLAAVIEKLVAFSPTGDVTRAQVRDVLGETPATVASLRTRRHESERAELVALLESCGGNLAEVARRLGLSRGAIIYRARKHGLLAGARSPRGRARAPRGRARAEKS